MIIGLRGMKTMNLSVIRITKNLHRDNSHNSKDSHRDNRLRDSHKDSRRDNSHSRTTGSNEEAIVSNNETSKKSTAKIEYKSKNMIPQNSSSAARAAAGSSTPTALANMKQSAGKSSRRRGKSSMPRIKG